MPQPSDKTELLSPALGQQTMQGVEPGILIVFNCHSQATKQNCSHLPWGSRRREWNQEFFNCHSQATKQNGSHLPWGSRSRREWNQNLQLYSIATAKRQDKSPLTCHGAADHVAVVAVLAEHQRPPAPGARPDLLASCPGGRVPVQHL